MSQLAQHHHLGHGHHHALVQKADPGRRVVADLDVIPVEQIVDGDLPVAVDDVLLDTIEGHDIAFVQHALDADTADVAQIVEQAGRRRIQGREVEALVVIDLRRRGQAPLRLVNVVAIEVRLAGNADQPAVQAVGPAVVAADKSLCVAKLGPAQRIAAMAAGVQQRRGPGRPRRARR